MLTQNKFRKKKKKNQGNFFWLNSFWVKIKKFWKYYWLLKKILFLLVLPFKETSISPELYIPPRFRILGGRLSVTRGSGGWNRGARLCAPWSRPSGAIVYIGFWGFTGAPIPTATPLLNLPVLVWVLAPRIGCRRNRWHRRFSGALPKVNMCLAVSRYLVLGCG